MIDYKKQCEELPKEIDLICQQAATDEVVSDYGKSNPFSFYSNCVNLTEQELNTYFCECGIVIAEGAYEEWNRQIADNVLESYQLLSQVVEKTHKKLLFELALSRCSTKLLQKSLTGVY